VFRLKFMPTPSGPLHLGHAWIIILMDRLATEFRRAGERAELVLMLDVLTNHFFGKSQEMTIQRSERIVNDLKKFGVKFDVIVSNDESPSSIEFISELAARHAFQHWKPELQLTPEHYLRIAWLDAQMGITHIVRGTDRLIYDRFYRECYELLGYPAPRLAYVPVLSTDSGSRISAGCQEYLLAHLLETQDKHTLWQLLLSQCVHPAVDLAKDKQFSVAQLLEPCWTSANESIVPDQLNNPGRLVTNPRIILDSSIAVLA
jgi:hypothetical protein